MFERVTVPLTLNPDSLADFDSSFMAARHSDRCRVILVTGGVRYFCTGMDLDYVLDSYEPGFATQFVNTLRMVRNSPKPVLACVEGAVIAGGMALLSVADIVVSSEVASFRLPEASFGVAPAIAIACLRERIAPSALKFLAWTSSAITARRAFDIGLVDYISTPDALDRDVRTLSKRLAGLPSAVLSASRTMLGIRGSFDDALEAGCDLLRSQLNDPGIKERIRCYREVAKSFNGECVDD